MLSPETLEEIADEFARGATETTAVDLASWEVEVVEDDGYLDVFVDGEPLVAIAYDEEDIAWVPTEDRAPHVAIEWDGALHYRHPFPPTFEYAEHEVDGDVATVTVEGSWDPGDGSPQEGRWTFEMKRHEEGWQVRPMSADTDRA